MKGLTAAIIPLAGVGAFWLLYRFPQHAWLIWGLLIIGTLLGLAAAIAGVFTPPQWAPKLLYGWILFVSLLGVLLAVVCLLVILWIGDHIGKSTTTEAQAITTALGAAIGVIATTIYTLLSTAMSYEGFARRAVKARYDSNFPTAATTGSIGFNAGRAAVRNEGGTVEVPAGWNFPGAQPTTDQSPKALVPIEGWGFRAVGVRRGLIQKALAEMKAEAATGPKDSNPQRGS